MRDASWTDWQQGLIVSKKEDIKRIREFIEPYRFTNGKNFKIKDLDPGDTQGLKSDQKDEAKEMLRQGVVNLASLQDKLYAQDRWGILLVFQAMDAAGKDSTIKHVMSGINPQGCQVYSFKQPSTEDLDHDFLWRYMRCLPERGRIGIFNRSYYEEVLVVRVHKEILQRQKMPAAVIDKNIWDERLETIANYEKYLANNGFIILKFFLNVSRDEQKKRFLARLDDPKKNWKFASADLEERQHWDSYMSAYQEAIRATASKSAPWYVVPADNKWFTRLVVAGAVVNAMDSLGLDYPSLNKEQHNQLQMAREILVNEK
jgi:PPK2 family polyphosphate:nucleotide phosphotransferase